MNPALYISLFVLLLGFTVPLAFNDWKTAPLQTFWLLVPLILSAILFPFYWRNYCKNFVFPLMDRVLLENDCLLIQKGKVSNKVFYSNIQSVEFDFGNYVPHRVLLNLKNAIPLGKQICFSPRIWVSLRHNQAPEIVTTLRKKMESPAAH